MSGEDADLDVDPVAAYHHRRIPARLPRHTGLVMVEQREHDDRGVLLRLCHRDPVPSRGVHPDPEHAHETHLARRSLAADRRTAPEE